MALKWSVSHIRVILAVIVIAFMGLHYFYNAYFDRLWVKKLIFIPPEQASFHRPLEVYCNRTITKGPEDLQTPDRHPCPSVSPHLIGPFTPLKNPQSAAEVEEIFPDLSLGGQWRPRECTARDRVAIIIPYRDREAHLYILLRNLHAMLRRQQLDYGVFVIEQADCQPFNRGTLLNIGFLEALRVGHFDCFIFHDVDLIPEDDRNLYTCPKPNQPRHMSVALDRDKYQPLFGFMTFGGVSAVTKSQFERVNGFSNRFWGWGGEDDDIYNRLLYSRFQIERYSAKIARYSVLTHPKAEPNPERFSRLHHGEKRMTQDGLNTLMYARRSFRLCKLFTYVLVELPEAD